MSNNDKFDDIYSKRNIKGKEYSVIDIQNLKDANANMDKFIQKQQKVLDNRQKN